MNKTQVIDIMKNPDELNSISNLMTHQTVLFVLLSMLFSQIVFGLQPVAEKYMIGEDVYNYRNTPMTLAPGGTKLAFVSKGKIVVSETKKSREQLSIPIPDGIQFINTLQWDGSGNLLAFSGINSKNSQNEVYIWDALINKVDLIGKTVINTRRGGYRDRHPPVFWLPQFQKLIYISRVDEQPGPIIYDGKDYPTFGPRWGLSESSLEKETDSLSIYRSFAYSQALQGHEHKLSNRGFDTIVSHINLFDFSRGTSQVLLTVMELDTGPSFSFGLTEVVPFPDGKQLFVAYRPDKLEEFDIESRNGFILEIPDETVEDNQKSNNFLDLIDGVILPTKVLSWKHKLPFGYNNTGAWVPSAKGGKMAWMVHENPKNLETDLRKTIYTLYIKGKSGENRRKIRIEHPNVLKLSALEYPSDIFKPDIEWDSTGEAVYTTVGGLLWKVDGNSGDKQLLSQNLNRVIKNLLSVSDDGILIDTFDPKTGKNGIWWMDLKSRQWIMVREEAKAYGNFHLDENSQSIIVAFTLESLAIPSNVKVMVFDKIRGKIINEIQLTHIVSKLKDMEHIVFNYSNKGPQPGIGIIIRGKNQKGLLPVILKTYPASPVSRTIMHYGMSDWIIDVQKTIDEGYAVMFVDTPILPGYGKVGPSQDILWGIAAALNAAEKTGWFDRNRMGIIGHSNGGYLVNTVVTHRHDFKAAVSIAGISNLVSYTFNSSATYKMVKTACRMELPLNQAPDRYVLNSPLAADLSLVNTPLLLIHGENDGTVPVSQAYEMFLALANRGKLVQLNNFKHEGHNGNEFLNKSFDQALEWFDFHLKE